VNSRLSKGLRTADFQRLFSEHADALLVFLAYRCGDRGLAEDVLSDTFERALRARRRFDVKRASEKTWLYSIAANRLRDELRRRSAERRAFERLGLRFQVARDDYARMAERDEYRSLLALVSEEERQVLALRFGAGMTVREIAGITGERRTTAEGRLYRGLARLRHRMVEQAVAE
jgi:RNA polymerase sigma-70 factor (ECF subfamily)